MNDPPAQQPQQRDDECLSIIEADEPGGPNRLDMMTWLHTEGGRKCMQCGRYAKPEQLGWAGFRGTSYIVDAYGHLPGFGCNRRPR